MTTLVLVHGAWHGAWAWSALEPELEARGVAFRTVDLPSVGDPAAGLATDVEAVTRVVEEVEGAVVLVGHSYGGAVISAAGAHERVVRLVYVTAFVPDAGESLLDQVTYGPLTWIVPAGEGLLAVETGQEGEVFYGDVDGDTAAAATLRLRPQSAASFTEPLPVAVWRGTPSTYVVCTEDQCIPEAAQREWATRCTETVELRASHSPFLSQPVDVADLLAARV